MKPGLINAFYINSESREVEKVNPTALPPVKNEGDYVWIQLNFTAPETRQLLQSLNINDLDISALTKSESRPRVNISNEELLLIVRGVNLIKGEKPENMISIRILATKNRLITYCNWLTYNCMYVLS